MTPEEREALEECSAIADELHAHLRRLVTGRAGGKPARPPLAIADLGGEDLPPAEREQPLPEAEDLVRLAELLPAGLARGVLYAMVRAHPATFDAHYKRIAANFPDGAIPPRGTGPGTPARSKP